MVFLPSRSISMCPNLPLLKKTSVMWDLGPILTQQALILFAKTLLPSMVTFTCSEWTWIFAQHYSTQHGKKFSFLRSWKYHLNILWIYVCCKDSVRTLLFNPSGSPLFSDTISNHLGWGTLPWNLRVFPLISRGNGKVKYQMNHLSKCREVRKT